jgi:hypothetical protein
MVLADGIEETPGAAVITLSQNRQYFEYYLEELDAPAEERGWVRSSEAAEIAVTEAARDHRLVWLLSGHKKLSEQALKGFRKRFRIVEDHEFRGARALLLEVK